MNGAARSEGSEADEYVAGVRLATHFGLYVWPLFTLLDVFMGTVLYPDASLGRCLTGRVLVELVLAFGFARVFDGTRPRWLVSAYHHLSFVAVCVAIAVFAIDFGGLASVYVHGATVAMLVQTTLVPGHWLRRTTILGLMAASFPLVLLVASASTPSLRAQFHDPRALLTFASNYVFVVACGLLGAMGGHITWTARKQLYEARKLGRYRLKAPIGRGGMGEVWLARDESKREDVALKVLRAGEGSDIACRRFEREAHAVSDLRCANTIRVFDYGASDDGIFYIAMEYLRGVDLANLVHESGPVPEVRALELVRQACRSLDEAHRAGIVHRDVKPANLFLTADAAGRDFLKVLDFGIARFAFDVDATVLTRTGAAPGTPAYMAPELCTGHAATPASDVYALGAVLYFLLSGAPPFVGPSDGSVIRAHLADEPPRLREHGVAVSAEVEGVVRRALAKSPTHRFATMAAFESALVAAANGTAVSTGAPVMRPVRRDPSHGFAAMDTTTMVDV